LIESPVECGYLSVLEDRAKPEGRRIELLVTRVTPPGTVLADPMLVVGADIAFAIDYPGIAPLAERVHREVFMLDQRGMGHSEPSLTCTELYELPGIQEPQGEWIDGVPVEQFLDAVQACHDRLVDGGVDLNAYDLAASAADVEDLRRAVGVEQWNLISFGTSSRVAFEVARREPQSVRSMVLDSPDVPEVDLFSEAVVGTRESVIDVDDACAGDPVCAGSFTDLPSVLDVALADLDADPVEVTVGDQVVVIDGATMIRFLRSVMAIPDTVALMPSAIDSFQGPAGRDYSADDIVVTEILTEAVFSFGYTTAFDLGLEPAGVLPIEFSHGLQFTITCRDEMPFVDRPGIEALVSSESWYRAAYIDSLWGEVCARWDVDPSDPIQSEAVVSEIPTLFLIGRFDPYSPRELVETTAAGFSNGFIVEFPHWSHNALGDEGGCSREIRNHWIDSPTSPPETGCIDDLPAIVFESG
jgi:pimeloyl-ACP methyl ester carboxylesterase